MKIVHNLISRYHVSAVDYMWGFFGSWEGYSIIGVDFEGGVTKAIDPGLSIILLANILVLYDPATCELTLNHPVMTSW